MGGVDKTALTVDGRSLLERALAAVTAVRCTPIVVMGPCAQDAAWPAVRWAREDPPFGGPAAAVVAGLRETSDAPAEWMLVLACDLPHVERAVAALAGELAQASADVDGLCLADATGHAQWLLAAYRRAPLERAAASVPDEGRDQSMRALLSPLTLATITADSDITADIDTWDDYARITKGTPP